MNVKTLVKNLNITKTINLKDIEIETIFYNSKQKTQKGLFVCLVGENTDGHEFVLEAKENGAECFITEKEIAGLDNQIVVKNSRIALSKLASNFYNNPEKKLKKIAVVGTNGKTSTTYIMKSILEESDYIVGLIGTRGSYLKDKYISSELTTPDPLELYKLLNVMVDGGADFVVMEVSAHAIYYNKTNGIIFDTCVFTNITQDHLDFFKTMNNYSETKINFFTSKNIKSAVVNIDDNKGREIVKRADVPVVSYGIRNPSDVFAVNITKTLKGSSYVINLFDEIFDIKTNLPGEFNVYNTLGAITACSLFSVDKNDIMKALQKLQPIEGRFNVKEYHNIQVVIDFAHTPDGIEKILSSVKELSKGNIITVFGCGGNRDKSKRPQMGKIAETYSDFVILTSDNPRFENPELILDDIEKGMCQNSHIKIISRRQAINFAIRIARKNDTIVVCGKGGEEFQDVNGIQVPYIENLIIEEEFEKVYSKDMKKGRGEKC